MRVFLTADTYGNRRREQLEQRNGVQYAGEGVYVRRDPRLRDAGYDSD